MVSFCDGTRIACGGGRLRSDHRAACQLYVNYVVETDIVYAADVRDLCPSFTMRATALSALFVAAEAAGLDFTRVTGDTLELAAFQARDKFRAIVRALPFVWLRDLWACRMFFRHHRPQLGE